MDETINQIHHPKIWFHNKGEYSNEEDEAIVIAVNRLSYTREKNGFIYRQRRVRERQPPAAAASAAALCSWLRLFRDGGERGPLFQVLHEFPQRKNSQIIIRSRNNQIWSRYYPTGGGEPSYWNQQRRLYLSTINSQGEEQMRIVQ